MKYFLVRSLLVIAMGVAQANAIELEYDEYAVDNQIITPSRFKQALKDSPSSVTVITDTMIERYGITSLLEALRLVPGFQVDYRHDANVYANANYHGTNSISSRRLNIRIDGVSLYRPALAYIPWDLLPIHISQIKRIEFVRNPSSASYGQNSFMGVIDITTKRNDEGDNAVRVIGDNDNGHNVNVVATKEMTNTSIQMSITETSEDGPDKKSNGDNYRAANIVDIFSLRSQSTVAGGNLNLSWKYLKNEREVDSVESGQVSDPDHKHYDNYFYIGFDKKSSRHEYGLSLSHNNYKTEQRWRSCRPTIFLKDETYELYLINPAIVADLVAGNTPTITTPEELAAFNNILPLLSDPNSFLDTCGDVNQDYTEATTLLELSSVYSTNKLRISNVFNLRKDRVNSETYFNGTEELDTANIFSNAMWLVDEHLTLNAGIAYEKGESMKGLFSPRVAANFHIDPNNTIRIGATKSYRTTDIFEQKINWRYKLTNIYPNYTGQDDAYFYATARSNGSTEPEAIIDKEIAYIGMFPQSGLNISGRIFKDKLYNLYSQKLQLFTFNPDSIGSVDLEGAELELLYAPSALTQLNVGVAYLENKTDFRIERTQYSRWSGFIAISHQFTPEWRTGFAYYGASNDDSTASFDRYDLTISYFPERLSSISVNGFMKYLPSSRIVYSTLPNPAYETSNDNIVLLEDDNVWIGAEIVVEFND